MKNNLWIGLIKLHPLKKDTLLGDCEGAYTNFIAQAKDRNDAILQLKLNLKEIQCELSEIETLEKYINRIRKFEVEEEINGLAEIVQGDGILRFGTFHTY